MEFNFQKYQRRYAMHCKTEEEAKEFCETMHKSGLTWRDGDSYIRQNYFGEYQNKTCYDFNKAQFSSIDFYEREGYTILKCEDFIIKPFTKSDIKMGMLVITRNNQKYIVTESKNGSKILASEMGYMFFDDMDNDFKRGMEQFDIMQVYSQKSMGLNMLSFGTDSRDLLYNREEEDKIIELTIEQIAEKLGVKASKLRIKD